jgi:Na+-driven multidrug efflux pump
MASQSLTIVIINNVLRKYGGDLNISTYGITNRITIFLMIPLQGIVQGIQPMIGYNYGAGSKARVGETLKAASSIAGCYGLGISILITLIPKLFLYPFTSEAEVINIGSGILKITSLGMIFTGIHMMQLAYFQAIGKSRISLVLSLCNYILCFIPVLLVISSLFGVKGIWLSFPLSSIITLAISSICLRFQMRREKIGRI